MANKNEFRDLMRAAEKAGWKIEQGRAGHLKWKSPTGQMVVSSATPSDSRAIKNHLALMRRYGYSS